MKKLSEESIFDNELYKLDTDIIWKKADSAELKNKLITDINKRFYRTKFNKFFSHSIRMGAFAAVVFIGFIFVNENVSKDSFTNGSSNKEQINQPELPIKNGDQTVVFTEKEQNKIESYNVSKIVALTEEATISLESIDSLTTYSGKPQVIAKKEQGKVLVNLLYPGDKGVNIQPNINEKGSETIAYDSLIKEYPKYIPITSIHNHSAILIESENQKSYLFMVTDKFIYEISGSKNTEELIKIAELINIKNSGDENKPAIVRENSEIVKVNSLHESSEEGLSIILQNAPFKVVTPTADNLSLTHAYMNKVRENTKERNVDISYQTPSGEVHIWQSNLNIETSEKDPFNVSGYEKKTVKIGAQNWYFSSHKDDKELLIFTTKLDDKVVSVDGKVPYAELVEIILSLK